MDRGAAEPAEILGQHVTFDDDVRRAMSVDVEAATLASVERHLDARRGAIASFFGITLGDREGAGFLRYARGAFYRAHRDRGDVASWPAAARRQISLIVFLNDGAGGERAGEFSGGELRLHDIEPQPVDIVPRQGMLVAFPATALHEVLPVREGTRDVIVDWFYEVGSRQ
jgi:predicted 2-oxoglutarate/Fe(II)-dependent dioxygenase YbiX